MGAKIKQFGMKYILNMPLIIHSCEANKTILCVFTRILFQSHYVFPQIILPPPDEVVYLMMAK
jgi:hypothetical protein